MSAYGEKLLSRLLLFVITARLTASILLAAAGAAPIRFALIVINFPQATKSTL